MTDDATPEILPAETESEILFNRLIDAMRPGRIALNPDLAVAEGWETIAATAVTCVLRRLRVIAAAAITGAHLTFALKANEA